jgi:hypothetical protein
VLQTLIASGGVTPRRIAMMWRCPLMRFGSVLR